MSRSPKRRINRKQLQLLIAGWFGATVLVSGCMFVLVMIFAGDGLNPSGSAQRPTRVPTRPVATAIPATPIVGTGDGGGGDGGGGDTPLQYGLGDDGRFALGGQVPPYLEFQHLDQMNSAGMSWVKYQIVWTPEAKPKDTRELIQFAHEKGFKVLVSIKGALDPTSIDFDSYLDYVTRLFSTPYLPDGIEIWNEMNFNKEWPANDISGTSYVNKLVIPVSKIVREKSPNTIIISGAPTPTGAFNNACGSIDTGVSQVSGCDDNYYLQQMRDANIADYIDCVGVHFNSGATSPTATTGHPNDDGRHHYSWYYQPMVDLYAGTINKPLCFTELGFASAEGVGTPPVNFPWVSQITVAQQSQWLGETVAAANKSGKVRLVIIWNVDFPSSAPDDPQAMYAIVRPDGTCPACSTLKAALSGQ